MTLWSYETFDSKLVCSHIYMHGCKRTPKQSSVFLQRALMILMNQFSVCGLFWWRVLLFRGLGGSSLCVADYTAFGSRLSHLLTLALALCEITQQDTSFAQSPLKQSVQLWMVTREEQRQKLMYLEVQLSCYFFIVLHQYTPSSPFQCLSVSKSFSLSRQ